MWHDVSSSLNKQKLRKSKVDKSDLLNTFGPSESLCDGWITAILCGEINLCNFNLKANSYNFLLQL